MNANDRLKQNVKRVRDAVQRGVRTASKGGRDGRIAIERPTNIKVATNIRRDGGTAHADATQRAPIEQSQEDELR